MKKRAFSALFSLWFAVFSVMVPARAHAMPPVAGVAGSLTGIGGAMVGGVLVPIAGLVIGAVVSYYFFPTNKGDVKIYPKSSAESATSGLSPSAPVYTSTACGVVSTGESAAASCSGLAGACNNTIYTPPAGYNMYTWAATSQTVCRGTCNWGEQCSGQVGISKGCAAGNTLFPDGSCYTTPSSGSTPALGADTGHVTPLASATPGPGSDNGDGFKNMPTAAPSPQIGNRPLPVEGTVAGAPAGSTTTGQVASTASGGITSTTRTYNPATNTTEKKTATISPAGVVTGTESVTEAGNTTTITNTTTTSTSTVEFPTDYNREITQAGIRADAQAEREAATTAGQTAKDAATAAVTAAGTDASRWTSEALGLPTKDQFTPQDTSRLNDVIPADTECHHIDIDFIGRQMSLNPCPVVTVMKPILNWAVMALALIATWQFILGRREESA